MRKLLLYSFLLLFISGCGNEEDVNHNSFQSESSDVEESIKEDAYPDGTYCAEVDYYNPNTGTSSTYTLEVEVESNELTTIHWPSGGWLDDSHFSSTDISEGDASFTSDRGYEYTVKIIGEGGGCSTTNYIEEEEEENSDDESYN
ncbi:hypothetical protein [Rufibacter radiotolerans]|uniref:hypothetical protein n=1 Tax=Rufibacter radiotolerans TaxID=1379910 RepID=UPI0009715222|nr:hypothetical protein [Rufibacter radiotolerans]